MGGVKAITSAKMVTVAGYGRSKMWYVLQTYTGKELKAAADIRDRVIIEGEDAFVLCSEVKRHIKGEWIRHNIPAFKSYLFVETEDIKGFEGRLRKCRRKERILSVGDELTPMTEKEEKLYRELGGEEHLIDFSIGWLEGDRLVVTSGAMKDLKGRIKHLDRHHRMVRVELPLMGELVEVELGLEVVRKEAA